MPNPYAHRAGDRMRKVSAVLLVLGVMSFSHPGASRALASKDRERPRFEVEYLGTVPFDGGIAVGARLVGNRFFVTSQKHFSIYDVSDPLRPLLLSSTPFGFKCCNEDVATNGKVLLFSEIFPNQRLHLWDVTGRLPVKLSDLAISRQHTVTCVLDCKWAYGAEGGVFDLRNPAHPTEAGSWNFQRNPTHDFEEFRPGFIINAPLAPPWKIEVTDVRNALAPRRIRASNAAAPGLEGLSWFHQAAWPREGRDRFLLMGAEGTPGPFMVFDAQGWRRDGLILTDRYELGEGTVEGDSSHWFDVHPKFRNGGLVAVAWNDYGTRILEIDRRGRIHEVGSFQLPAAEAEAAYWIDHEIVYSIDYYRGIDILRVSEEP